MNEDDIRELVRASVDGDLDQLEELIRQVHGPLISLLYLRGIPDGDVDDVAQEVALQMCRSLARFDPDKAFLPWFRSIVRHVTSNYWRTKGREKNRMEIFLGYVEEAVESSVGHLSDLDAQAERMKTCVERLLPKYQEMLSWRYTEECTAAEIARRMSMKAAAVRQSFARIRAVLRECIRARPEAAAE